MGVTPGWGRADFLSYVPMRHDFLGLGYGDLMLGGGRGGLGDSLWRVGGVNHCIFVIVKTPAMYNSEFSLIGFFKYVSNVDDYIMTLPIFRSSNMPNSLLEYAFGEVIYDILLLQCYTFQ